MSVSRTMILEAFLFRHACKVFDADKTISDDNFNIILESARLSPSSFGFEPWQFLVVQNKELREQLKEGAWGATIKLETASHFVVALAKKSYFMKYDSDYIEDVWENKRQLNDEMKILYRGFVKKFQLEDFDLTDERKLLDWSTKQTYIPLANMMTTAALLGIDSCPIEGFVPKITNSVLEKHFGIDIEKFNVAYMVAFGYRKEDPKRPKSRMPMDEVVKWYE